MVLLQWLFILEGGPAVLLGLLVCWRLPADPERAAFLQPAERQWCLDRWRTALLLSIALTLSWGAIAILCNTCQCAAALKKRLA